MNSLLLPFSCGPNTIWFPHDFSGTPQKEEKIAQLCVQATCSVVIGQGFKFGHALQTAIYCVAIDSGFLLWLNGLRDLFCVYIEPEVLGPVQGSRSRVGRLRVALLYRRLSVNANALRSKDTYFITINECFSYAI